MQTYWDYTEKQRAKLTDVEVKELLDIELMVKGVKKIEAPILKQIQKVSVATETWFEVDGNFFKTAELAQQFIALDPRKSTYDYTCGYDYHYACPLEQRIEQRTLYSQQDLLNLATVLKQNKVAKEENEKAVNAYEKEKKAQDAILNVVWENWWECISRSNELQAIVKTKEEYLRMAEGKEEIAMEFLSKVYSAEDIKEALTTEE